MLKNKFNSLLTCLFIYCFTFYLAYILVPESIINIWLKILVWHILATIFVYIFSVILKNSSLYDPFWSIAPIPIVIFLSLITDFSMNPEKHLYILIPVIFWALRLTHNWIIGWPGFKHEDFRYVDLKNTTPIRSELINFFGIHLIPTLQVNLSLLPLYYIFISNTYNSFLLIFASLIAIIAVVIETVSDYQMRQFKSDIKNKGITMKDGLWKYSRHPNYFGEVLFWFSVYLFGLSSNIIPIWTFICPLSMYLLFIYISCPMMDNRSLKNRSDYQSYMDNTSQLIIWFKK